MGTKKRARAATPKPEPIPLDPPAVPEKYRNRITGSGMVPAKLLRANPKNWRTHPEYQKSSVRKLLETVGWVARVTVYTHPDGTLELVNGHLRTDIADDDLVPVDYTDLTPAEADLMLATMDQTSALAGVDTSRHRALLEGLRVIGAPLESVGYSEATLRDAMRTAPVAPAVPPAPDPPPGDAAPVAVGSAKFRVVVTFPTEAELTAYMSRLAADGIACQRV